MPAPMKKANLDAYLPRRAQEYPDLNMVREIISTHLGEIAELFREGTLFTLVARQPGVPSGAQDFVLSNDKLEDVITALETRRKENRG